MVIKTGILNHIITKARAEGRNPTIGSGHLEFVKSGKYEKMKKQHRALYPLFPSSFPPFPPGHI